MKSIFSSRRNKQPHKNDDQERKSSSFFSKKSKSPFFNPSKGVVQTKLSVGKPGDKYEKEADSMADAVVNNSASKPDIQNKEISSIQRESLATPLEDEKLGTAEKRMEEDKLVQEKPELQRQESEEEEGMINKMEGEEEEGMINKMEGEEEEGMINKMEGEEEEKEEGDTASVQTKTNASGKQAAKPGLSTKIKNTAGKGKQLSTKTRMEMESSFGRDFKDVNVHTDQDSVEMNKDLKAQAFTHGKDIYFDSGKFNPETSEGKRLLAHELTHVVQQGEGEVKPKIQTQLFPPIPIIIQECHEATSGSANPGPGIQISFSGTNVNVTARLQVHGPAASGAIATSMKNTIERLWTGSFPDGYTINTTVSISHRADNEAADSGATQIYVHDSPGQALGMVTHMWGPGARTMRYNLSGTDIDWSPAHEFGHLLGLDDKYSETWGSVLWGLVCPEGMCSRETQPDAGYENNIMGINQGILESKNVRDIIEKYRETICRPLQGPNSDPTIA